MAEFWKRLTKSYNIPQLLQSQYDFASSLQIYHSLICNICQNLIFTLIQTLYFQCTVEHKSGYVLNLVIFALVCIIFFIFFFSAVVAQNDRATLAQVETNIRTDSKFARTVAEHPYIQAFPDYFGNHLPPMGPNPTVVSYPPPTLPSMFRLLCALATANVLSRTVLQNADHFATLYHLHLCTL